MRFLTRALRTLALPAAISAGAPAAAAQTSGGFTASAAVVAALTVTGTADLAFGTVASSQIKTIAASSGGTFTVRGAADLPVSISFTLPTNLGVPAVAIGSWTGLANGTPSVATAASMVPSAAPQSFTLSNSGRLFVWIGATLTTTLAPTGSYSVPLTLTVVYN